MARHFDLSGIPEFTARSVVLGLLVGSLLCFTNLYFGLQTGWISMMSLQSALLGRLIGLMFKKPFTVKETVILQTTAVATGTMPLAAGFVGIIPALSLLTLEQDGSEPIELGWLKSFAWSCAVAFFGVFLAAPLRKQVIIKEKLAFPSGAATAQLLSVLYEEPLVNTSPAKQRRGYQSIGEDDNAHVEAHAEDEDESETDAGAEQALVESQGWSSLIWSFSVSGIMTLAAYFFPVVFAIPVFGTYLARQWCWWFTPSLSYVGQGIIMGFPTTLSMNLGMFVGWGILSPIAKHAGWAPGPVADMSTGSRGWILWVALSIMSADSITSLTPVVAEFYGRLRGGLRSATSQEGEETVPGTDIPMKWAVWGLVWSLLIGTVLVWFAFGHEGIKPWATLIGFLLGGILSLLGVRALGETDLNPVSGLGKISQLVFAVLQPGSVVASIVFGGVAEAGAQQAGDLMQDFKTGYLLGVSPRAQFYGQLIGSGFSILVTVTAYHLYTKAYPIPGPNFPAPSAFIWLSLARLLRSGKLPEKSALFMIIFGVLAALVSVFRTRYGVTGSPKWAVWLPSGVAFAIGFLNTPSFSIARLIGGVLEFWWRKRYPEASKGLGLIVVASGFVLGEGVVSVVGLILRTFGIGVASCWGCPAGICGGCP